MLVQGELGEQWWAPAGAVVSGTGQNLVLTVSLCGGPSGAPCLARKSNCTPTEVAVLSLPTPGSVQGIQGVGGPWAPLHAVQGNSVRSIAPGARHCAGGRYRTSAN